jgi:golgi phosphoprotein 3
MMTINTLTLADELLLLALDDTKGSVHSAASLALDYGLVGAVLIELTVNNRLTMNGKQITVVDPTPVGSVVLDDALRVIGESTKQRSPQDWVGRLSKELGGLRQRLLDDLVARDVLERREDRVLRIFPVTRYPERNGQVEDDIRGRIDRVLLEQAEADDHTILLLRLIKSCNLVNVLYQRDQRKLINQRIDALSSSDPYTHAVDQAIVGAQTAINSAIIAASISATTAACSSSASNC